MRFVSLGVGGGPRVVVSTAAFHARVRGSGPGLGGLKETKLFLPHPRVKVSTVGSLHDREVACSASDRQGSNFESCVWRTVSSQSSHHPQEVLLAQCRRTDVGDRLRQYVGCTNRKITVACLRHRYDRLLGEFQLISKSRH